MTFFVTAVGSMTRAKAQRTPRKKRKSRLFAVLAPARRQAGGSWRDDYKALYDGFCHNDWQYEVLEINSQISVCKNLKSAIENLKSFDYLVRPKPPDLPYPSFA